MDSFRFLPFLSSLSLVLLLAGCGDDDTAADTDVPTDTASDVMDASDSAMDTAADTAEDAGDAAPDTNVDAGVDASTERCVARCDEDGVANVVCVDGSDTREFMETCEGDESCFDEVGCATCAPDPECLERSVGQTYCAGTATFMCMPGADGCLDATLTECAPGEVCEQPISEDGRCVDDLCGDEDDGSGVPESCRSRACAASPTCVDIFLREVGAGDFEPCGEPQMFGATESILTCLEADASISPLACRFVVMGDLAFLCSPDRSRVAVRFSGSLDGATFLDHLTRVDAIVGDEGRSFAVEDGFIGMVPVSVTPDGDGFLPKPVQLFFRAELDGVAHFVGAAAFEVRP